MGLSMNIYGLLVLSSYLLILYILTWTVSWTGVGPMDRFLELAYLASHTEKNFLQNFTTRIFFSIEGDYHRTRSISADVGSHASSASQSHEHLVDALPFPRRTTQQLG